jgi:predicted DsbA family dithiol-disulfide isomerase
MTRLEIISDPVCPWCYIGVTLLFRALEARPGHPLALSWRPYQLNPDMPPEGMDRADYLAAKFGGGERAAEVYAQVERAAEAAGLAIDFAAIPRAPNTLDAHRLIHWAEAEAAQSRVAMALFRAYFQEGADISDTDVLRGVAEGSGLDGAVIGRLLAGEADRDAVQAEADGAARMGVTGVPTFILGGRYALVGAQATEVWTRVIDELAAASEGVG